MKKVFILTILLLMLAGTVSAYELVLDCPTSIQRGDLLVVNGSSNLPAGTYDRGTLLEYRVPYKRADEGESRDTGV